MGITPYIISGGFYDSILPVALKLGVPKSHVVTNTCIYDKDGICFIDTSSPAYSDDGKAPVIMYIKKRDGLVGPSCMIGDGSNDIKAYELNMVEHFCGFTANIERKIIKERSPHIAQSSEELVQFISSINTV